ncbi:MAG: glycosyltransferase family 39 protein, partial [Betaproteobacteria bacterium]|nr:glycosyltransferase family 39 protein [Betaproteobacteria bacterium]
MPVSFPSFTSPPALLSRLSVAPVALALLIAYLLPGLVGHDPWKSDEAYIFGLVYSMLESGDWVVPMLAGEPFVEKPPLYYWLAAGTAHWSSPWLSLHDGARLASGVFSALALASTGLAGRALWGSGTGWTAALVLAACLGFLLHARTMLTDLALLAGFAVAFLGLALACRSRARHFWLPGVLLGAGAGMAFLGKGLLGPGLLGLVAIVLPVFPEWRTSSYRRTLLIAALTSVPWLTVWPIALYLRSPELFDEWLWRNNIGRFFGFADLGAANDRGFWWSTLPWFTFPALPLAVLWLGAGFRHKQAQPQTRLCLVVIAVVLAVLGVSASARAYYGLPLLVPLAVLGTPAIALISDRLDKRLASAIAAVFLALSCCLSGVWLIMRLGLDRGPIQWLSKWLPFDFNMPQQPWAPVFVGMGCIVWLTLIRFGPRHFKRVVTAWVGGLALLMGVTFTLLLPWLDAAKSYRETFTALQHQLPRKPFCVSSSGLGESERAQLHYVAGIKTERLE